MNAKELRVIAEKLADCATDNPMWQKFGYVAGYVLATVRDDDDEPSTDEWECTLLCEAELTLNQSSYVFYVWGDARNPGKRTRGQFRALCKGLGIELKERDHETE